MAAFSIIKKSELEGAQRIDAEYYQPDYLLIEDALIKRVLKSELLKNLIKRPVVTGSTPARREPQHNGTDILFVKTDTVRSGEIVFDNADKLPIEASRKNSEPKCGDVLVTIIGATHEIVGRAARVFPEDPKMNINQNVVLVRPADKIMPGYLESFLRGKYGRSQLWQHSRQTEQVNLNCREVELVKVPVLSMQLQKKTDDLVTQSHLLLLESQSIYKEAERLLLGELGIKKSDFEDELSYSVDLSDIEERIDAEYYQPKYKKIYAKLNKSEPLIKNFAIIKSKNFEYDPQGSIPVVQTKQLSSQFINYSTEKFTTDDISSKGQLPALKNRDVAFASMGVGSLGKTNMFYGFETEIENITIDSTIRIFRPKKDAKILPEVLTVFLSSRPGQTLIYKYIVGTSGIISIYGKYLENLPVPILNNSMQQKIGELVHKSHEARKKSKKLLEDAKTQVEQLIEQGSG